CGLVAASLGSAQRIASLRETRSHVELIERSLATLEEAGPLEGSLTHLLERARQVRPVQGLVVRDTPCLGLGSAPHRAALETVPGTVLEPDTLLPRGGGRERLRNAPALPRDGGRLALVSHQRQVGWLDFWGD